MPNGGVYLTTNFAVAVREPTDVAEARRTALAVARRVAFDEDSAGRLAIVVTEAATNVIKHGGGGAIVVGAREEGNAGVVEVFALDRGAGIVDIERSRRDGFSTAGSPGNGLGAIARLSTTHEIYSARGLGTVVMARICCGQAPAAGVAACSDFEVGAICVPQSGEDVSGDSWVAQAQPARLRVLLADGLGHGPGAFQASIAAVDIAEAYPTDSPADMVGRVHDGLRSTRGAAVAVAEIDTRDAVVRYAGLGNVAGSLVKLGEARRQMVSHNGTAGHNARKIQQFTYPWRPGALLILHSDGIGTHWSLDRYPGIFHSHPSVIAAVLFRDFQRGRDDAAIVVARQTAAASGVPS